VIIVCYHNKLLKKLGGGSLYPIPVLSKLYQKCLTRIPQKNNKGNKESYRNWVKAKIHLLVESLGK